MLVLLLALGCANKSGDVGTDDTGAAVETGDSGPAGEGVVALTFAMDADYIDAMDEAPVGRFWGTIWNGDDVTNIGPNDGAVGIGDIYIETLDLTPSGEPTGVLFTSDVLPAGEICVLGFMDSDVNADADAPDPDKRDPVTLPSDNRFDVVADETTTIQVYFGFLNP